MANSQQLGIYFVIKRFGRPSLRIPGYAVSTPEGTPKIFNRFGQPVELSVNEKFFATGKTVVDGIKLQLCR